MAPEKYLGKAYNRDNILRHLLKFVNARPHFQRPHRAGMNEARSRPVRTADGALSGDGKSTAWLSENYAYPAYGIPSEETKKAIRICKHLEGMITDPVYEAKSMQSMIDLVKRGYFEKGARVLYAHFGGAPALNGYGYALRNG
jgi:hypothetical protein